jgi:hypothetical protein
MSSTAKTSTGGMLPKRFAADAKFYKPKDDTSYAVTDENLVVEVNALHNLMHYTPMGHRLSFYAADLITGGRFTTDDPRDEQIAQQEQQLAEMGKENQDLNKIAQKGQKMAESPPHVMKRKDSMKTGEEKKLENFFEDFWEPFNKQVAQTLGIGAGMMVYTKPGEKKANIKSKVYSPRELDAEINEQNRRSAGSDKPKIRWYAPETKQFMRGTVIDEPPHLDILDWARDWQWWDIKVDKSRLHPLCLNPTEEHWYGLGDIEPCVGPLYGLYNMGLGILDRIGAWSLQLIILRIDVSKALGAKKAQIEELVKSMGASNWKMLDKAEDLVQLNDKAGTGMELLDMATNLVSMSTGWPTIWLKGNTEGAITGSEVDLTQVQLLVSNKQTKLNNYIKRILDTYYNVDADELFWKMSVFTTAQALQGQGPNAAPKPNPFGGGSKPNPMGGGLKTPQRPQLGVKAGLTDKTPNDD